INMGCPAKKICNVAAGSALLENEALVARIVEAVVAAVPVPVTVKIRTGPSPQRRNAVRIARLVEAAGAQMLAIHGRTRACMFEEYADEQGPRVARKHIGWTVRELPGGESLRGRVNGMTVAQAQRAAVNDYFERLAA